MMSEAVRLLTDEQQKTSNYFIEAAVIAFFSGLVLVMLIAFCFNRQIEAAAREQARKGIEERRASKKTSKIKSKDQAVVGVSEETSKHNDDVAAKHVAIDLPALNVKPEDNTATSESTCDGSEAISGQAQTPREKSVTVSMEPQFEPRIAVGSEV